MDHILYIKNVNLYFLYYIIDSLKIWSSYFSLYTKLKREIYMMIYAMWIETMNSRDIAPDTLVVNETKKETSGLLDNIFGKKFTDLLDKVSKVLWGISGALNGKWIEWENENNTQKQENINTTNNTATVSIDKNRSLYLWDLTYLAQESKNKNQAWAKNNNPTGITWPLSKWLGKSLDAVGIRYSIGTPRPSKEWGNYVKFETMEEWIHAYWLALSRNNDVIADRLKSWVWWSAWHREQYVQNIMKTAFWAEWMSIRNKKFNDLTEREKDQLLMAQLKQESSSLYALLQQKWVTAMQVIQSRNSIPDNTQVA